MSHTLVGLMGLSMTVAAVRGRGDHARGPDGPARGGPVPGLIRAAGLTPCPSGTIVLLFALANGVFRVDLEACLVMAVGMGPTVSVVGVIAIVVRRGVVHPLRARPRATRWVSQGVAVAGGAPPPSSVASSPSAWGRGSREGRR